CNYCTSTSGSGQCIEGRDNHCLLHLTNPKECLDAPPSVCNEACRVLLQKGAAIGLIEAPLFCDSDTPACYHQKRKSSTLNNYVDHTLTAVKRETANMKLFHYVIHSNSPFSVSENSYFLEFINYIWPSYVPPTHYVLLHTIMDSEYAQVSIEEIDRLKKRQRLTLLFDG
ncbi:hypothetical protein BDR07DRAFT_1284347, partial [Suillus spraguei]